MVVLPTLGFDRLGDVMIVVHSTEVPSEADWDRLLEEPLQQLKGAIVIAGATRLDARKRRLLSARVQQFQIKVAVLVSSSVARGVVTALGWLVGGYRAFEMTELEKAAAYVGIAPPRYAELQLVARELQARLKPVRQAVK